MRGIEAKQSPVIGLNPGVCHQTPAMHSLFRTHFPCTSYFAANPINVGRVDGKAAEQSWHHKAFKVQSEGRQYDRKGLLVRPIG